MSDPYVSPYDQVFLDAFARGIQQMPEDQAKLIKAITDNIHDAVISSVHYYVAEEMKSNLDGEITRAAAKVAQAMLMDALAGNDAQIRNLFGFTDYYMKHSYIGNLPTQWNLIDALIERKPELFVNEKIAQQESEIKYLKEENARIKKYADDVRERYS